MYSEDDQDEVKFWHAMIRQWEASHSEPAPKRMREALELAEFKHRQAVDLVSLQKRRIH